MCGIVGIISKSKHGFDAKSLDTFELMLFVDTIRGEDSTGVFLITNEGNVEIAKQVGDGAQFVRTKEWKEIRSKAFQKGWALIGHNRKATRGSITDENAHPFWVEDKTVLVHNGSITGHKKFADVEVDSHAIAHHLTNSVDKEKALKEIDGAFALVWHDVQSKVLNVIRNEERPLHHTSNDQSWFISSEQCILEFAMIRAGAYQKGCEVHNFPAGMWHKWTLADDHSCSLDYMKVELPKETYYAQWRGHWQENFTDVNTGSGPPHRKVYALTLKSPSGKFSEYLDEYKRINYKQSIVDYSTMFDYRTTYLTTGSRKRVKIIDFLLYKGDKTSGSNGGYLVGEIKIDTSVFLVAMEANKELFDEVVQSAHTIHLFVEIDNHEWVSVPEAGGGYPIIWGVNPTKEKETLL